MKRILMGLGIFLVALVGLGFFLLWSMNYFPADKVAAELSCKGKPAATLKAGMKLKILSWNIQYGASRKYHFFYDGGKAVHAEKPVVQKTIKELIAVVKEVKPDIIMWQEIDRNSKRTHYIDQLKELWKGHPEFACWAAAPYHKSAFLPHPGHKFLGRVDMELAVFSRFKINRATRHALPMLKESFFRRAFNLKRAVLEVEIPVEGGKSLVLLDTHFSAFSFGDGTLDKQVKMFQGLAQTAEKKGGYWVAAGDLNLLPPGDDPKRLGTDASYYAGKKNPIDPLFKNLHSLLSLADYKKNPTKYNTYSPPKTRKTDRWIDHVFVGSRMKAESYQPLQQHVSISDHLPIVFELTLKK